MADLLLILLVPAAWWLGGTALAWLIALLRPDTLRSGVCKHCGYDRLDVHGALPCPECGLSIAEARRRIPKLPRLRETAAAIATTAILPAGVLVYWLLPTALTLWGPWVWVAAWAVLGALGLVCIGLPFAWAQVADWRFGSRLSGEIGWSFVAGPVFAGIAGAVANGTRAGLAVSETGGPGEVVLLGVLYGAVVGVGLGPALMTVWVLGGMAWRGLAGDERGIRPAKLLH